MTHLLPKIVKLPEVTDTRAWQVRTGDESHELEAFMALPEEVRLRTAPGQWPCEIKEVLDRARYSALKHGVSSKAIPPGFRLNPSEGPFKVQWEDDKAEVVPRKYLAKRLIPRCGVVLLSGPSGAGKSFIGIDLAGSLATGFPFFGERVTPGGTLILASEAYGTFQERLKAYRRGKLASQDEAPIYPAKFPIAIAPIDNISKSNVDDIIARCKKLSEEMLDDHGVPLRLIIIDTLAAASGMEDENSSTEATAVMKLLQRIAAELEVVVMPVVHHGKSTENGVRGSSAFEASADAILTVQRTKDQDGKVQSRSLSLTKSRDEETGWCHAFELDKYILGIDEDCDEITSCYVIDIGEPEERPSKAKKNPTAKHCENLMSALDNIVGTIAAPTDDGWVAVSAVRARFAEIDGKTMSEAFRKQCERAENEAELDGKIEFIGARAERKMRRKPIAEWK